VRRIRQLEERLRRIEQEKGIASSELLGVNTARSDDTASQRRKKKSPKKGSPKKSGRSATSAMRVKESNPHLDNIVADPSLGDLLSAVGVGSESEEDSERGRKARVMAGNIKSDNSSLSMNSGQRFSSNQRSSARSSSRSRSVTRRSVSPKSGGKSNPSSNPNQKHPKEPSPRKSPEKKSGASKRYEEKWKRRKSEPDAAAEGGDWGRVRNIKRGGNSAAEGKIGSDQGKMKDLKSANANSPYIYHLVTSPPGTKSKNKAKQSPEEIRLLKSNIESGKLHGGKGSGELYSGPAKNVPDLIKNLTKMRIHNEHEKRENLARMPATAEARKEHQHVKNGRNDQVTPDLVNPRHLEASLNAMAAKATPSPAKKEKKKKKAKKASGSRELHSAGSDDPASGNEKTPDVTPPPTPPHHRVAHHSKAAPENDGDGDEYGDEDFEKEYADEDFEDEEGADGENNKSVDASIGQNTSNVSDTADDDSINHVIRSNMAHHTNAKGAAADQAHPSDARSPGKKSSPGMNAAASPHSMSHSGDYSRDEYEADRLSPPLSPPEQSPSVAEKRVSPKVSSPAAKLGPEFQHTAPAFHSNGNALPVDTAPDYGIYDESGEDIDRLVEQESYQPPQNSKAASDLAGGSVLPEEKKYTQKAFYTKGEIVEGNYRQRDKWYPGKIGRSCPDGTYEVDYDDGEQERLEKQYIRVVATKGSSSAQAAAPPANNYLSSASAGFQPKTSSGMSYGSANQNDDGYNSTSKYGNKGAAASAAPAPAAPVPAPVASGYQPSGFQPKQSSGMSYGSANDDDDGYNFSSKYGNKGAAASAASAAPAAPAVKDSSIARNPFKIDSDSDSEEIAPGGAGKGWGSLSAAPKTSSKAFSSNISPDAEDTYADDADDWGGRAPKKAAVPAQAGKSSWQTEKSPHGYSGEAADVDIETGDHYEESFDDYEGF
jgi:hypothetical protein